MRDRLRSEDRDGQLGQITEEDSRKEHTNKEKSLRASQVEDGPHGPGGADAPAVNYAINEPKDADEEEKDSFVLDTAFHNDKKRLK